MIQKKLQKPTKCEIQIKGHFTITQLVNKNYDRNQTLLASGHTHSHILQRL